MTRDTTTSGGAQPDPPLDDFQRATVRAADGMHTEQDLQLLSNAGRSCESIREQHERLSHLLAVGHPAPELADRVMHVLNLAGVDARSVLLYAAGPAPELSERVLSALGQSVVGARDSLLDDAAAAPDLVPAVMGETGLACVPGGSVLLDAAGSAPELSAAVAETLDLRPTRSRDVLLEGAEPTPELMGPVLDAVDTSDLRLREVLLERAGDVPMMSGSVMEQLDLAAAQPAVGSLLRDEAGPPPDLSGEVLSRLGLASPVATPEDTVTAAPTTVVPLRRRWALLALPAVAMAAAALLFVSQAVISVAPTEELIAFSTDVANRIEIEDISTDVAAVVHVIPGDFDDFAAPTIIFIDELDEEIDSGDSRAEGR